MAVIKPLIFRGLIFSGARRRQSAALLQPVGTDHAGCRAAEGAFLATLGGHAVERAAGETAQPAATRRFRGETHQQQVGDHCQVLARYRAARHHAVAGTGRAEEVVRRWAQHLSG